MKRTDIEAIGKAVATVLSKTVLPRIKSLEQRLVYKGTFNRDAQYQQGNFATHQGSLWHCEVDNPSSAPGSGSKDWKLATKRGKDGKDADTKLLNELRDDVTRLLMEQVDES